MTKNQMDCIKPLILKTSDEIMKSLDNVFKIQGMTNKDWTKIEEFVKKNKSKSK